MKEQIKLLYPAKIPNFIIYDPIIYPTTLALYPAQGYLLWDGTELCIKKESGKLVIYKPNKFGQFADINTSILTHDIFNEQTRTKLTKFLLKFINVKKDDGSINRIIDKFYEQYQEVINFEKEQNDIRLETQRIQKLKHQEELKERERIEKEKFKQNKPEDLLDLIPIWDKLFSTYSNNNHDYSRISLHLLIGQCIINSRLGRLGLNLDPRISVMYFKPSGTGGSAGYNIVADVAERIGLKCNTVASATDAAMIGSVEMIENPETGEREEEQIKGLLDKSRSNIIYWAEPEGLFEKNQNQHEGNTRRYIQSGLNLIEDRESKLSRDMKHGTVIAECEASIMLATIPPQSISDKIIDSGLMQRFCFINKVIDIKERILNAIWDTNNLTTIDDEGNINRKDKIYQNRQKQIVTDKLLYLKQWGEKNKEFYVTIEATKYFNIQEHKYFKEIESYKNVTDRVKDKMQSFQQFTVRKSWQIAMHHAALRFSTTIEKEDIKYASEEIIQPQMKTMLTYLEESWINEVVGKKELTEEETIKQKYYEYRGNNVESEVTKQEFLEIMSKTLNKSQPTVYRKYKKLITKGLIAESKEGNVTFVGDIVLIPDKKPTKHFDKKETPYQGISSIISNEKLTDEQKKNISKYPFGKQI